MGISMDKVSSCFIMAIDIRGCTPMENQKVRGPMPGLMVPFIRVSSRMD